MLILKNVLYSLGMRMNLVFIFALLENSYKIKFFRDRVSIKFHNVAFAWGILSNGLINLNWIVFKIVLAHSLFLLVMLV